VLGSHITWWRSTVQTSHPTECDTLSNTRKVHSRRGREGPQGEEKYSSTVSLTLALDGGWWSTPRPGRLAPAPVSTGEENLVPHRRQTLFRRYKSQHKADNKLREDRRFHLKCLHNVITVKRTYTEIRWAEHNDRKNYESLNGKN
jgi:hypothetical protein